MKPNLVSFSEASKYIYHSKTLIFYCDHGNHSLQAARELAKKGKWASSIAGGYEEMKK